ncbi:MAG: tRNA-uridine aminocarboxypropyltransferase [Pseudomonadales bacterium]
MSIFLLTHPRECERPTNTGALALNLAQCDIHLIKWQRTQPCHTLLAAIDQGAIALLYPGPASQHLTFAPSFEHFIILDGTWQEAQKIYNKSPYLHTLPTLAIDSAAPSIYTLRRNQREAGLCTAETVEAVLRSKSLDAGADELHRRLEHLVANRATKHLQDDNT